MVLFQNGLGLVANSRALLKSVLRSVIYIRTEKKSNHIKCFIKNTKQEKCKKQRHAQKT